MAKERLKSPPARLFVALDLPDRVRDGLEAWQAHALTDPALRPVRPEALHVTLCFLNYHPERAIESIASVVTEVEPQSVEIRLQPDPKAVPPRRPRLFAVEGDSLAASELQAELSDRLEKARFYKPEKREFWTHVTIARVRSERGSRARGGRGKPMRVESSPGPLPAELAEPFRAPRLALYRSFLRPSGAEYVRLAELNLTLAEER
ncbi:MAG: RNA 2',3'-cyclic phosphodiesterase [Solirubrobacterales bacterium]